MADPTNPIEASDKNPFKNLWNFVRQLFKRSK